LESIEKLSGQEFPCFVLKCAKELDSWIFRITLLIPGIPMLVVVGEGGDWRQILHHPATTKPRETMYGYFEAITGGYPTMFSTNGDFWYAHRKAIAPAFLSSHIRRMNQVALEKTEEWLSERLRPMIERGESFDVSKEMINIMLDSISETAFEYKMGAPEEKDFFLEELDLTLKELLFKTVVNPTRAVFGAFIPTRRRAWIASERMYQVARKILNDYRQLKNPTKDTIIDRIMTNKSAITSHEHLAAEIILFWVAGHDTTGYSLAWLLLALTRRPDLQRELRTDLAARAPSDWSQSEMLRKLAKESMRLSPVTAGSIRATGKDLISKNGCIIPKGSIIFLPVYPPPAQSIHVHESRSVLSGSLEQSYERNAGRIFAFFLWKAKLCWSVACDCGSLQCGSSYFLRIRIGDRRGGPR
jgi:cytochrome P450